MTSQKFQQDTIDRAKGIIATPMPRYWYDMRWCEDASNDNEFNKSIAARYKPYFMKYVYPHLKSSWGEYQRSCRHKLTRQFRSERIKSLDTLRECRYKVEDADTFIKSFEARAEYGTNPCTVNKICWHLEEVLPRASTSIVRSDDFNYEVMKAGVNYSRSDYDKIAKIYIEFQEDVDLRIKKKNSDEEGFDLEILYQYYQGVCSSVCPNGKELCDIILDLCYQSESSKYFAWAVVGDEIIDNLLNRNGRTLRYPVIGGDDFTFGGYGFHMEALNVSGDINENIK